MSGFLAKILGYLATYFIELIAKTLSKFIKKSIRSAEDKKKIKEALALEDRKEAARRLNEIFKK